MSGQVRVSGSDGKRRPLPAERRRRSITATDREKFLAALAAGWSVTAAAQRTTHHRQAYYELRDRDEAFGAEWEAALEAGCDVLEDALRTAASEGWDEETYDGEGSLIRRTRRRDPRLNERLLERRRPTERASTGPVTLVIATAFPGVVRRAADVEVEASEVVELDEEEGAAETSVRTLHIGASEPVPTDARANRWGALPLGEEPAE